MRALVVSLSLLMLPAAAFAQQQAAACAALTGLKLPETKILQAEQYAAGQFPALPGMAPAMIEGAKLLPALCRVVAVLTPTTDSSIKIEVWMPVEHWNGRFSWSGQRRIRR